MKVSNLPFPETQTGEIGDEESIEPREFVALTCRIEDGLPTYRRYRELGANPRPAPSNVRNLRLIY